jgi:pre-mRNA-processing factor 19
MTSTLEVAATFSLGAPVQALVFSENGFWFAAAAQGQSTVTVFDLRKEGDAAVAKTLETGGAVAALAWDYTGQYLASAGPSGVTVQQYAKGAKRWAELFRVGTPAVGVAWGEGAQKLLGVGKDGEVVVFGAAAVAAE